MAEFKWKGREKEWHKEYREKNKERIAEKRREHGKLNPWYLEKKIINEKLRTGKINKVEHHAEMNIIDKERMKNKIENFRENRRNIIKEIKSALDENEQKRNKEIKILEKQNEIIQRENTVLLETLDEENKKIKEMESENETIRLAYNALSETLEKKKIALKKIRNEPGAWKTKNKRININQLDMRSDKPTLENIINNNLILPEEERPVKLKGRGRLKQRMDEMFLEKERLRD